RLCPPAPSHHNARRSRLEWGRSALWTKASEDPLQNGFASPASAGEQDYAGAAIRSVKAQVSSLNCTVLPATAQRGSGGGSAAEPAVDGHPAQRLRPTRTGGPRNRAAPARLPA